MTFLCVYDCEHPDAPGGTVELAAYPFALVEGIEYDWVRRERVGQW